MRSPLVFTPPLLLMFACEAATDTADALADSGDGSGDTGPVLGTPPEVEEVTLATEDDVELVGDYYGQTAPTPAILLLHMVPPTYDRRSWPVDFIEQLRGEGWSVLALDRRGAGDSGGNAVDAYDGPLGVLDAYAAVDFLVDEQGATALVIIGASNGSTTTMDYAVEAAGTGRPVPRGIAWMSPGTYTEAQHRLSELTMADVREVYPTSEARWPEKAVEKAPAGESWTLHEYDPGSHGSLLFSSAPEVADDIVAWLAA
jgi:pimeloyl-ACP methyl ester carboxylesterase